MSPGGVFGKPIPACDSSKVIVASFGLSAYHVMNSRLLQYRTKVIHESACGGRGGKQAYPFSIGLGGSRIFSFWSCLSQTKRAHNLPTGRRASFCFSVFGAALQLCRGGRRWVEVIGLR